ncbi:MAG: Lipopolysaccharide export system protein LptC [Burkholderiaceae bacterium]|nr:MAG: Lipopolysaccharide export system protein LptC [Burkholderiaceae bacterium]
MKTAGALARDLWEQAAVYLPIVLMGVLALGTYWLVRSTPIFGVAVPPPPPRHEPDYFMRDFAVRTFDAQGRLKNELFGTEGRHYPDTDTMEITNARIRAINPDGRVIVATARRALSNSDASQVQLFGNAVVVREPGVDAAGHPLPRLEYRGEFLNAYPNQERVTSNKPVTLTRGNDRFTGDSMDYDNYSGVLDMRGRVRGVLEPGADASAPASKPAPKPAP